MNPAQLLAGLLYAILKRGTVCSIFKSKALGKPK